MKRKVIHIAFGPEVSEEEIQEFLTDIKIDLEFYSLSTRTAVTLEEDDVQLATYDQLLGLQPLLEA